MAWLYVQESAGLNSGCGGCGKTCEGQTGTARCLWQGAYRRFVDAAQDGEE